MYEKLLVLGRGVGQVMFQDNALSGLLMLIGIVCSSIQLALLALIGSLMGSLVSLCWRGTLGKQEVKQGLWGFNGTLVGIAGGVFLKMNNMIAVILVLVGIFISSCLFKLFSCQNKFPAYTAPFILVVWGILLVCSLFFPELLQTADVDGTLRQAPDYFHAFSFNVGQVMFQGQNVCSGIFFLLAIGVNSKMDYLLALLGAILPLSLVVVLRADYSLFNAGLLGYNGVLCSIACAKLKRNPLGWAILSILLSIGLQMGGLCLGITTLTAPFVLSMWIVWCIYYVVTKNKCDECTCSD